MYENFSSDPAFFREFFTKNKDRIVFGTDSTDEAFDPASGEVSLNAYAAMEIDFLSRGGDIEINGETLHGLGLPADALDKIFYENYLRWVGGPPRALDVGQVIQHSEALMPHIGADEAARMNEIVSMLKRV
jgi:predicted TIM-barrel fold metal-dependent hydrolase